MGLAFRLAAQSDYAPLEKMVIDCFEPITWAKRLDENFGPFRRDWRERWRTRFANVFSTQVILVGEEDGEIAACATAALDRDAGLGYIDLLAVDKRTRGKGYGRDMLRAMLSYMKEQGCEHAHLECMADNTVGNSLYRSEGWHEIARIVRWYIKIP